jgi:hypothetical protein
MKKLKNISDAGKGILSLCLVVVFLFSLLVKMSGFQVPAVKHFSGTEKSSASKLHIVKLTQNSEEAAVVQKALDSDPDDFELVAVDNLILRAFMVSYEPKGFKNCTASFKAGAVPLYDLFCNWKSYVA